MPDGKVIQVRVKAAVFVGCLCFGLFVWPSLYRYDEIGSGGAKAPVRTNRLTGTTYLLTFGGWEEMRDGAAEAGAALSAEELRRITGTAQLQPSGWISADLYNGNDFKLQTVDIQLRLLNRSGAVQLDRRYRLGSTGGGPLTSSNWICESGHRPQPSDTVEWNVVSAAR